MNRAACPSCGNIGDEVGRVTLESLLRVERRGDIGAGPHYVCAAPECDTVYFGAADSALFRKGDLTVRFGLKEKLAPRPACYCFGHSLESIHAEVEKTGQSTVLADIKSRMADPGCFCERANPTGRCCLASVKRIVGEAMERRDAVGADLDAAAAADCCAAGPACAVPQEARSASGRSGMLATSGSVVAAALSSACCWVPLLLLAFGASAAGAAGFFDRWRWPLAGLAAALLGTGFYLAYRSRPALAADCCSTRTRGRRLQRGVLWAASVFVVAMIFFPSQVWRLVGALQAPGPVLTARAAATELIIPVEGMTCETCAARLETQLASMADLTAPSVSYDRKAARVGVAADSELVRSRIIGAVRAAGFEASAARIRAADGSNGFE